MYFYMQEPIVIDEKGNAIATTNNDFRKHINFTALRNRDKQNVSSAEKFFRSWNYIADCYIPVAIVPDCLLKNPAKSYSGALFCAPYNMILWNNEKIFIADFHCIPRKRSIYTTKKSKIRFLKNFDDHYIFVQGNTLKKFKIENGLDPNFEIKPKILKGEVPEDCIDFSYSDNVLTLLFSDRIEIGNRKIKFNGDVGKFLKKNLIITDRAIYQYTKHTSNLLQKDLGLPKDTSCFIESQFAASHSLTSNSTDIWKFLGGHWIHVATVCGKVINMSMIRESLLVLTKKQIYIISHSASLKKFLKAAQTAFDDEEFTNLLSIFDQMPSGDGRQCVVANITRKNIVALEKALRNIKINNFNSKYFNTLPCENFFSLVRNLSVTPRANEIPYIFEKCFEELIKVKI